MDRRVSKKCQRVFVRGCVKGVSVGMSEGVYQRSVLEGGVRGVC